MSSTGKSGYSDGATDVTTKMQGQLTFLMGAYERLSTDAEEKDKRLDSLDSKISAMDSKLDAKLDSILLALGKQPIPDSTSVQTPIRDPMFSASQSQVRNSNFDQSRENFSLGYRRDQLNLDNRENMLKKIEMSIFDGTGISEWMVDVEYFFELGRYDEESKMDLVPLCLRGALKKWYAWVMRRGGFLDWGGV